MDDKRFLLYNLALESEKIDKQMLNKIIHEYDDSEIAKITTDMNLDYIHEAGLAGNIAGILISPAGWFLWRTLSGIFDKNKRKCGMYTITNKRDICIANARIAEYQKKIAILKQAANDKNNANKQEKIKAEIEKLNNKILVAKQKVISLKTKRQID